MDFNRSPQSADQEELNEQYDKWANIGESSQEPEKTFGEIERETAKDIAAQLGVNDKLLENPQSMARIKGKIIGIEEEPLAIKGEGWKHRAPNEEEKGAMIDRIKVAKPLTLEEADTERRNLSMRGKSKNIEGISIEDDGTTVETSSFKLYPHESPQSSFGYRSSMKLQPDGTLIIDRIDYSSRQDKGKGLYEHMSGKRVYNADGILLRDELIILGEDGLTEERIIHERDSENPLLSKEIRYEGDSEEPTSEKYGIIDKQEANSLAYLQRKEGVDPKLSWVGFSHTDEALVFDTREQADAYFREHPDEKELSARTGTVGLSEDKELDKKVQKGFEKLLSE